MALDSYPDIHVISYGLEPAGVSVAIDALKKGEYQGFKSGEMKPA